MCEVASRGNLYSGNNLLSANDISYSALGPSPSFSRAYSSQWSYNGPIGYGWTFNCNTSLDLQTEGSVVEIDETGAHYTYTIKPDGTYEAPSGRNSVLTKNIADSTFLLTEKDQSTKKFRADGKLLYISDRDGNTMTFEYDTDNRLVKIKDSSDRETQLTYNANGKISKIVDPAQRKVEYTYDSGDNLIKVNDIAGLDTSYAYDSSHKLTTITSFDNKTYTFSYDSEGKLVSRTDYASDTSHITYDTATNTSTVKDPKGNVTTYKMDDKGRATSVIDPSGAETKYTWDANNNVTEIVDPRGSTQSFTFDAKGNMLTHIDQLGKTTTYTYTDKNEVSTLRDALGNTRHFFYDAKGNLLKEIDTNGTTIASYTYDSHGNRTAMTDASGHTYHYEFDTFGNLVREKDPAGCSTVHAYDAINRRISTTDAKGRTTAFELGVKGQLIKQTNPDSTTTKYEWYPCCAILKSVVDANLNSIQYFYDSKRRLIRTQDAASGSTSFEYDENDNRTAITDPKGNRTTLAYDVVNRLESIHYPDSTSESLAYYSYGPIKSRTDGNGAVTTFEYDLAGRLTKKIAPDGAESRFSFDDVGNRVAMTDGTGTYAYSYDNLYRPRKITLPSGKSIAYSYSPAGLRVGMTDYAGKNYGYKYDIMNRLSTLTLPGKEKIQYSYDQLGLTSKISYPNATYTSYSYSNMNRIDSISNYHKALWKDRLISGFSYTYDNVGNRLSMKEKSLCGRPRTNVYAYDSLYRLASVNYPNKTEERYTYDAAGNRTVLETKKRRFCPCFNGWKWDDRACRCFVHYLFHPEYTTSVTKYDYDIANKLLSYKETKDSATVPACTVTMEYDRNGNEIKESILLKGARKPTVNTYGYNYDNRMVSALIKGIKSYEFTYNEDGNRIKTRVSNVRGDSGTRCTPPSSGDETIHLYDGSSLIMDLDAKGKVVSTYSYGLGLNAIDSRQLKGYYMTDALGSVTEVTGTRGNVLRSYRYSAWGDPVRGGEGKDVNPFLYVGGHGVRWQDSTLGLYHMRVRWMNSQTGRFISRMIQDPHHYVYALNNPINLIDPLGLQATPTPIPTVYPNNLHYDYPIHPNPTAYPNLSPTLYPTSIPTPTPTSNPPLFQNPFSPPGFILSHPQQPPPGCSWGYTGEMPSLSKIKKMCLYQNVLINTPQTFCMYEVLICINCRNITAKRLNQNRVGSNVFIVP